MKMTEKMTNKGLVHPFSKGNPLIIRIPKKQKDSGKSSSNNQSQLPADIAKAGNNINKEASSTSPDPLKQTKAQANKEQDKNPPTGPQKGATGNVKPPPAQEQGNSQQASIGEAGDQDKETNEKEVDTDDDEDEDDDDDDEKENEQDEGTIVPNTPSKNSQNQNSKQNGQNTQQQQQNLNQQLQQQQQQNLNMQQTQQQQSFQQQQQQKNHLAKLSRSEVTNTESDASGSGDSEAKEINDILDSMNKD